MADRLTAALDALARVPVPLRWDDVERRVERPTGTPAGLTALDDPTAGRPRRPRSRAALVVAAAVVVLAGAAALLAWPDDEGGPVRTGPGPRSTTTPTDAPPTSQAQEPTPTTQPAIGTTWGSAVQVWTGTEYLVWGGQVGGDDRGRADGWRHDPATGLDRPIPVAPIAPRDYAAGVWTGTELLVCCGRAMGDSPAYDTASAAAYDPAADRWRELAVPPPATNGYVVGSAWTGTELLVVSQVGDPATEMVGHDGMALHAYDPAGDRWSERAAPPFGDRFGEVVWTGDRLVLWARGGPTADRGVAYDPAADRWDPLPDLPADASVSDGSAAAVYGELLVFGLAADDETRTAGYRLRPGEAAWRPMAPAPLRPIEAYDGTPGSQTLVADEARGRLIVYPTNGYESGAGGVEGVAPPPLLAYDPATDGWTELGDLGGAGYAPDLLVGGDHLLWPERTAPVVLRLGP